MGIVEVRLSQCFSIRARAEPPRPLDCNKHFCANRVVYDRSRRGCRAHEEAEGGSAPSNYVASWYNHLPRSCVSSSCCGNMLLWHLILLAPRDHLGGLGSPVGRSARYVDQIPTQYDHGEGSEGLESHIRRSARFLYPRRLLTLRRGAAYQQSGPTTSDMAERFTGPCRECMEWLGEMGPSADDVYSCVAGCTSRALESGALPLTSASSRGRQSVNARAAVISKERQTDALSDSIFWLSLNGTLGPKKARGDPN